MKNSSAPKKLSFQSKLECIATGMQYFAVSVPLKTTLAVRTRGPVPVYARVNGSQPFLCSLYPIGGGRHYMRVRNKICSAVRIKAGSRVRVQIEIRDRTAEISIPKDLMSALRSEKVVEDFKALPIGKKSYLLRWMDQAAKPETRKKRIQAVVEAAHQKRER